MSAPKSVAALSSKHSAILFDSPYPSARVVLKSSISSSGMLDPCLKATLYDLIDAIEDMKTSFGYRALDIFQFAEVHTLWMISANEDTS